ARIAGRRPRLADHGLVVDLAVLAVAGATSNASIPISRADRARPRADPASRASPPRPESSASLGQWYPMCRVTNGRSLQESPSIEATLFGAAKPPHVVECIEAKGAKVRVATAT